MSLLVHDQPRPAQGTWTDRGAQRAFDCWITARFFVHRKLIESSSLMLKSDWKKLTVPKLNPDEVDEYLSILSVALRFVDWLYGVALVYAVTISVFFTTKNCAILHGKHFPCCYNYHRSAFYSQTFVGSSLDLIQMFTCIIKLFQYVRKIFQHSGLTMHDFDTDKRLPFT